MFKKTRNTVTQYQTYWVFDRIEAMNICIGSEVCLG